MNDVLSLAYIPQYASTLRSFAAILFRSRSLPGFTLLVHAAEDVVRDEYSNAGKFELALSMFCECHALDQDLKWALYDAVRTVATLNVVNAVLDEGIQLSREEEEEESARYALDA